MRFTEAFVHMERTFYLLGDGLRARADSMRVGVGKTPLEVGFSNHKESTRVPLPMCLPPNPCGASGAF